MTKKVTLTFDNGPDENVTPAVLDELKARGISAWFCIVGKALGSGENWRIVQRAIAEGHRIANHSMMHQIALGDDVSAGHAESEIAGMHDLMLERLSNWGDLWYRPYGREGQLGPHIFSDSALAVFSRLGYSALLWNSVPGDWRNPQGWLEDALQDVAALDHTVIVLHDIPGAVEALLPVFLDELLRVGVDFTLELPASVVPVCAGLPTAHVAGMVAG